MAWPSKNKNPFEIFGLNPDIVAALSEKELFSVVKALYRTLLKHIHPDLTVIKKSKSDLMLQKSIQLNLAFEVLNYDKNPTSFRKFRKEYASRRPRGMYLKNLSLEKHISDLINKEERLTEAYFNQLISFAGWRQNIDENCNTIFPLKNLRLGLQDVAGAQMLRRDCWRTPFAYKQIEIDSLGQISLRLAGRPQMQRVDFMYLLGSIPSEALDIKPILKRVESDLFKAPALNKRFGIDGAELSVMNSISEDNFKKHILPILENKITERSYLFSLNRAEYQKNNLITLEGLIIKIEHL